MLFQLVFVVLYALCSYGAYRLFKKDKNAAQNNDWRISELQLHLAIVFSPYGSWFAMLKLHHKTSKNSFKFMALLATVAHVLLIALLLWIPVIPTSLKLIGFAAAGCFLLVFKGKQPSAGNAMYV
ncbi:hypothetical protein P9112_001921 [Eukaryota sp. TZLM1-RC]